jgi:serine/threonine protein kinase/predicted ATPase
MQSQPLELVPGEVLDGKYRVERLLGVGGMGAVYVAERLPLQDKVAIKSILTSQNTEINRARFLREARAAASVRHPNVVKIFDFGEPRGRPPYMVMEYLAGPTLSAVVRDYAPMPLARSLWIISGICAAVEAGHRRGVIHRDLKPGNVILSRGDDGRETVKVLDFGLARLLMETEVSALTSPGTMLGTCSYMSPELIEANLASGASDIYALGVILYEMVTGRSPFRAENNAATIWKITTGEYERPADLVPDLPQEVCAGIEAALARNPKDRPASPEELAARVGAPLAASASEHERPHISIARSGTGVQAAEQSGSGAELPRPEAAPSLVLTSMPAASEVTTADVGVNLDGGERTIPPANKDGPAFSDVFVGRAPELDAMRREYRMTLDGRGRIVTIKGDAGVGKSRLIGAFGDWARSQGATVLRGRFFAYEGDQPPPYETFLWMLTAPATSGNARRNTVSPTGSQSGLRSDAGGAQDKWRAFASLTQGFTERARGRPLVLIVDDLQWGTALDLEFLAHVPRQIESPVMVVGTARTGSRTEHDGELEAWLARLGSQRALSALRLEGFGIGEVRAWFQACFPGIRIRPQDLRRLLHATSGNPYYLTEVVGQLVQSRRIQRNAQGYSCAPLDKVALPDTVHSVVQAKLEGLPEDLRTLLETACVIGEEFGFDLLHAALDTDEDELESQLERAVKLHLLSDDCASPASDFRFDTTTLRSVLYDGLSRRRRRRLHRKVVDALLKLHGGENADRIARVLCYHYHAVEDHEATLLWGLRAAEDTLAHYDHDHAELSLRRALEAAEALSLLGQAVPVRSAIDLDRLTGLLYARIGRLEEADAVLQRALEAAELQPDHPGAGAQRLDIMLILAGCQVSRGLLEVGIDLGQMALELAEELGDRPRELQARLRTARAAAAHGQLDSAALLLEPVIEIAEELALAPVRALAMADLALINAEQGAFDRAHGLAERALTLARECGDPQAEYRASSALGQIHLEGADLEIAAQHLDAALDMARSMSLRRREGMEIHQLSICSYRRGDPAEAEARAREALAIFLEIHDLASEGDCRVNLGRILRAVDTQQEEAMKLLEAGRELCATVGRRVYEGLALLEIGMAHTEQGALREAHEQLDRASELFGSIDSLHLWRSELALAKLALAEGDRPQAATHARRAAQLVDILRSRLGHALDHEAFDRSVVEVRDILDALMR